MFTSDRESYRDFMELAYDHELDRQDHDARPLYEERETFDEDYPYDDPFYGDDMFDDVEYDPLPEDDEIGEVIDYDYPPG